MTVGEALSRSGIERTEARMLLAMASGLTHARMAAHPEHELSDAVLLAFHKAVDRRRRGEPMAYLLGEREFYGLALSVTPAVLIPRPETELLVDFAKEVLAPGGTVADLGTGSGAIALAIKHERPESAVTAVDRSAAALEVARGNASRLGLSVEFLRGNWFAPLAARRFDLIVSNPPYVAEGDPHLSQGDLRFEPQEALASGGDGLEAIRLIVSSAAAHLMPGGWLAIEHGQGQDAATRARFLEAGLESVSSRPDLAGVARVTVGKYNSD